MPSNDTLALRHTTGRRAASAWRSGALAGLAALLVLGGCASKKVEKHEDAKEERQVSVGEVRMPSGVSVDALRRIEKVQRMKVYVQLTGIGEPGNETLLFPPEVARGIGVTRAQVERRFTDTVGRPRRFEVLDNSNQVTAEGSDYVIDAMVTGTRQELVPLEAGLRKARTAVRLSVQLKNRYSGELLFPRPVAVVGETGVVSGSGVLVQARDNTSSPDVQKRLVQDYEAALQKAYDEASQRIQTVLRPVGQIVSVDGNGFTMKGGELHGFQGKDTVIVFRTKLVKVEGQDILSNLRAIAAATCDGVQTTVSECGLTRLAANQKVEVGDYVVMTDRANRGPREE